MFLLHLQKQSSSLKNTKLSSTATTDSLYNNYYAYLRDARHKIAACQLACTNWSRRYEDEEEDVDDLDNENGNYDEYYEDFNDSSMYGSVHYSQDKDTDMDLYRRKNSRDGNIFEHLFSFAFSRLNNMCY
jgi:hypothetical protein